MNKKNTSWGQEHGESDLKMIMQSRKTGSYDNFPGFSWKSSLLPSSLWESWISFWLGFTRIIKELPLPDDNESDYLGVNSTEISSRRQPTLKRKVMGKAHFHANKGLFEDISLLI